MLNLHFCALTEIWHRIGGPGTAEHMPLDTLHIVEALRDLIKHAQELETRIAGLEKSTQKEEPRV
jgi:hypothetical protein